MILSQKNKVTVLKAARRFTNLTSRPKQTILGGSLITGKPAPRAIILTESLLYYLTTESGNTLLQES